MNSIDEFRQDKHSFIMWFSLYSTISFLAVCILFGVYICKSFDNGNIVATQTQGDNSKQGVAGYAVSIN